MQSDPPKWKRLVLVSKAIVAVFFYTGNKFHSVPFTKV